MEHPAVTSDAVRDFLFLADNSNAQVVATDGEDSECAVDLPPHQPASATGMSFFVKYVVIP